MARRQTPQEWQQLMDKAGLSSLRRLAEAAGIAHTQVSRIVHGDSIPSDVTVRALADALRVRANDVYELTHGQRFETRTWEAPSEVHRLSKRTQDALTELIRAIADEQGQRKDGGEHEDSSAPMNQAAGSAAEDDYDLAAHEGEPGIRPDEDMPQ